MVIMAIISGVGSIPRKREERSDVGAVSSSGNEDVMEKEDGLDVIGGCEDKSLMLEPETSVELIATSSKTFGCFEYRIRGLLLPVPVCILFRLMVAAHRLGKVFLNLEDPTS
jgi:hypothetical protein